MLFEKYKEYKQVNEVLSKILSPLDKKILVKPPIYINITSEK